MAQNVNKLAASVIALQDGPMFKNKMWALWSMFELAC